MTTHSVNKIKEDKLEIKDKIRKEMLARLKSQSKSQRLRKSLLIKQKLFKTHEFKDSKLVMFFVSKDYEVNTHEMIDGALLMGKVILVPKTIKNKPMLSVYEINSRNQLSAGNMGILEPKSMCRQYDKPEAIDLVIVPGIAFDKSGNRLGHGRGYYDRFLKSAHEKTRILGLAFDFQIVDKIPAMSSDFPVKKVISA